jgi:hypothetical protein
MAYHHSSPSDFSDPTVDASSPHNSSSSRGLSPAANSEDDEVFLNKDALELNEKESEEINPSPGEFINVVEEKPARWVLCLVERGPTITFTPLILPLIIVSLSEFEPVT